MRRSIFACGLLLALAGIPSAVAAAGRNGQTAPTAEPTTAQHEARAQAEARSIRYWLGVERRAQRATRHWLTVVRGSPPRLSRTRGSSSPQVARHFARVWKGRANRAWHRAHLPTRLRAWNCIHHYEGSWTDPNAPYWGGLQM